MGCLSARDVLWYLTFCGFAINYMLRININIAIVGMARSRSRASSGNTTTAVGYCKSIDAVALDDFAANDSDTIDHSTTPAESLVASVLNDTEYYSPNITDDSEISGEVLYTVQINRTSVSTSESVEFNSSVKSTGGVTQRPLDVSLGVDIYKTFESDDTVGSVFSGTGWVSGSSVPVSAATVKPSAQPDSHHPSGGPRVTMSRDESTTAGDAASLPPLLPTALPLLDEEEGRYDWDEYQQGLVLGAFFWLHWSTQIPGGMLSQRLGPKLVFGVSNLVACLLAVLLPLAASLDYRALIAVRVLQGFVAGAAWPSMHSMTANWIPPNDRSKFVTAYLGSSVGAALTFPLCGFLMEWFGWPTVFYCTALIGSVWFLAWWFLVFDHPDLHPRISPTELDYLQSNLGKSVSKRKPPTPWRHIVTSPPLWMNVLAQWGGIWGLFTLLTQAPSYFRLVHGWSIRATGLLSGFPHLCRISFAMLVSWAGDYMLKQEMMSRTNVRKIATAVCTIVQGLLLVGLAYSGCQSLLAAVFLAAAVGASGAVSTGPLASLVDISPNYASILMGITNMVTVVPGFISPIIVGLLTYQNQTAEAWRVVFLISAAMLVAPGVVYVACASSELQPWNTPAAGAGAGAEELAEKTPLKSAAGDGAPKEANGSGAPAHADDQA